MTPWLRAAVALAWVYLAAAASPAAACTFRQSFFESTAEGTLALIRDARSYADARRIYSGWCPVASNTRVIPGAGDVLYFGLNNRDLHARTPKFYIVKVYRRSRATELRPLLSLFRSGPWVQRSCRAAGGRRFPITLFEQPVIERFIQRVRALRGAQARECDAFGQWLADAHGDASLSLASTANFLLETPNRVERTGIAKWSLNVSAFAYMTEDKDRRAAPFPQLGITRDGADEIIVQYMSSGSKYHEFTLVQ